MGNEYLTTLEDGTMISGWDTGLAGLRKGDRAIIRYGGVCECASRVSRRQRRIDGLDELTREKRNVAEA